MMQVAVAVIRNAAGEVLLAQRAAHKFQGGLWEFPGGKLEPGEDVDAALKRECCEELGVEVLAWEPLITLTHHYPELSVVLHVAVVTDYRGEPQGLEGQPLTWAGAEALGDVDFPAANRSIVAALQLPSRYVITPADASPQSLLAGLQATLAAGDGSLVQLRAPRLPQAQLLSLAKRMLPICHAAGARLLVNTDPASAMSVGADGVHLSESMLRRLAQAGRPRPVPEERLLAASVHDVEGLSLAQQLGCDFVVLSPLAATASHPSAKPLGWTVFADWVRQAGQPVYALGGMRLEDVEKAKAAGAQGIAGISGLWQDAR